LLSHDPQPPTHILAAALMRRAMTDVQRVLQIRDSKQALGALLQKGLIGDDFWNQFQEAEKELEAELTELVQEANTFRPNWGQSIFAQANDMVNHQRLKGIALDVERAREQLVKGKPLDLPLGES
jgi:translocation protein SEC66